MASEEDVNVIKNRVFGLITSYPFSCDLIVSFFYASVFSDRFESRADPFPPRFIGENGEKDINLLRMLLDNMPPMSLAEKLLRHKDDLHYISLLDWLFGVVDPKTLEMTDTSQMQPIEQQPNIVFTVRTTPEDDRIWNLKKKQRNTLHAFYGTNLENMYSIVNQGLDPIFSTATAPLYGDGLYLTNQMDISLLFSPFSEAWKYSMLGERLRVLVLCEIINDPAKVKRLKKEHRTEQNLNATYIIVKDKSFVRVKYFFVYTKNSPRKSLFTSKATTLMCYVFLIALILYSIYTNRHALMDSVLPTFLN